MNNYVSIVKIINVKSVLNLIYIKDYVLNLIKQYKIAYIIKIADNANNVNHITFLNIINVIK